MNADQDPKKPTKIEDLPKELLFDILKWIKDESDLDNVQNVCELWYSLIDLWIGRAVSTSTQRVIHPGNPELSKGGLDLLPEIGVSALYIEAERDDLLENPPSPLPAFVFPYLLRILDVRSTIHPDLFNSLVKGTVNLEELWISLPALAQLRNADMKNLNFPRLRALTLRKTDAHIISNDEETSSALLNSQTILKEHAFRHLTCLGFDFTVREFQDLETIKLLMSFIQRLHAIHDLSVLMKFPMEFIPVDQAVYGEDLKYILNLIMNGKCCHSIKKLRIEGRSFHGGEDFPQFQIWKEFVKKQDSLQILDLRIGAISNNFLKTVCGRNAASLEKLRINQYNNVHCPGGGGYEDMIGDELDCRAFSHLTSLQMLELRGHTETNRTKYLPPTLVDIFVMGVVRGDEAEHILLHLPNLREMSIVNFMMDREGYSVGVEQMKQFIGNRRVRKALLFGMGTQYPYEEIPNNDPVNPEMLKFSYYLELELNGDGYYSSTGRSSQESGSLQRALF